MHEDLSRQRVCVLVVSLHDTHAQAVCDDLRAAGIDVVCCDHPDDALEYARRESPAVVAADLRVPGLNAAALRQALDAVDPRTRLVTFPVHQRTADGARGPEHDPTLLLRIVRAAVEHHLSRMGELDALRYLTRRAAHGFGNILTAVVGNLELLREHLRHEAFDALAALHCLEQMDLAVRQGTALTRNLIEFLDAADQRDTSEPTRTNAPAATTAARSVPV